MGSFGFSTGSGAGHQAQKAAAKSTDGKSTDGKSTDRRYDATETVAGIFLALCIGAGVLFLIITRYQVWNWQPISN